MESGGIGAMGGSGAPGGSWVGGGSRAVIGSRTAVVAAIPEEAAPLVARLKDRTRAPLAGATVSNGRGDPGMDERGLRQGRRGVTLGRLGDEPLAVLVTGDGAERARAGVRALLETVPVGRLVVIGSAGGLSLDLAPAEVIMARRVLSVDGSSRESLEASPSAARAAGARLGTVVTVRELALSSDEKRRVREAVARGEEAMGEGTDDRRDRGSVKEVCVVDLESAHFAEAAEEAGISWVVLRAVLDTAAEDLPDFLHACSGPGGEVRRPAVLLHAARHPRVIPQLVRMRSRIGGCGRALADAVTGYLSVSAGVAGR